MAMLVGSPLQWLITITAGSGFLLFGYDQGVVSGLLTGAAWQSTFPEIDLSTGGNGSASLQGTVVAIYEIGCFFGAIICFFFGEKLGRRKSILVGCAILVVGAAMQAGANSVALLIVGRIIAGLGNGMNTSTIPVWHSELLEPSERGKGLCIELATTIVGVMLAYWTDYGLSYVSGEIQFRFPIAFQILFALITIAGISILPESPRWLIAHDRKSEAREVIWSVQKHARTISKDARVVNLELADIQEALDEERRVASAEKKITFFTLFKDGEQKFRYRTLLAIGGQFMQQLSGINLITYYAPVIFEVSVGIPHQTSLLLSGFNGIAYFLSSLIPIWIVDRLGRRKLMLFAVVGQSISMAVLAITISNGGKAAGLVAVVMLFLFNFFFAIGLLAIPWLLPAEYAPLAIRTRVASLATASNWIFTFLVVEITPISIHSIQWRTYIYFSVFNACFIPIIYFFYPETRNLTLEQIDKLFTSGKVYLKWQPEMGLEGRQTRETGSDVSGEEKAVETGRAVQIDDVSHSV